MGQKERKGGLLPSLFCFDLEHFLFVLFSEKEKGRKRNREEGKKTGKDLQNKNMGFAKNNFKGFILI